MYAHYHETLKEPCPLDGAVDPGAADADFDWFRAAGEWIYETARGVGGIEVAKDVGKVACCGTKGGG